MFPGLREFLDELRQRRNPGKHDQILLKNCKKTVERGLKTIGAPPVKPHGWRHWFITEAVTETDVPFAVLANWVGHKDGGILLARNYSHLRESTSSRWAQKMVRR